MDNPFKRLVNHPLALNSSRHYLQLAMSHGGIGPGRRLQAARAMLVSPLLAPLRLFERVFYEPRVRAVQMDKPPVFVVGHWRTGTTHLHNLLTQDPNFGFVSTFQTIAPASFLIGEQTLKPLIARILPRKRHTDNMALSADSPQEEEFAMCTLCPHSLYVGWYFPQRMRELFRQYVLFDGVSTETMAEWRDNYLGVLKKAYYHTKGKQLVLKNPVNTGRIRVLLDLFPEAKFVHICRNPYVVFKSTQWLHRSTVDLIGLQDITDAEIEENVLLFFQQMMGRFLEERDMIPAGNLVELRYEDLEQRPIEEMERIYEALGLPGWTVARERIGAYVAAGAGYRKNRFSMSDADMEKVEAHWGFALEAWGYDRPVTEKTA